MTCHDCHVAVPLNAKRCKPCAQAIRRTRDRQRYQATLKSQREMAREAEREKKDLSAKAIETLAARAFKHKRRAA